MVLCRAVPPFQTVEQDGPVDALDEILQPRSHEYARTAYPTQ